MTDSMRGVMGLDGDVDKLAAFYDGWAAAYDEDVGTHGYGMPATVVATMLAAIAADPRLASLADRSVRVLDAGCGTGQVGRCLVDAGYRNLRGVDLSPEMVNVAAALGIYRSLRGGVDLTAPVDDELAAAADIVTVGGVFTVGHVPPEALATMAGLVRPGGLLVVSTRKAYHEQTDYRRVSARLVADGRLDLIHHVEDGPYTMDSTGDYWAYRVNERDS